MMNHHKKHIGLLLILLITGLKTIAQTDTVFVDATGKKTERIHAIYYKIDSKIPGDSTRLITRSYNMQGQQQCEIPILIIWDQKLQKRQKVWDGTYREWGAKGELHAEISYSNNKKNGSSTTYWQNGQILCKSTNTEGRTQDEQCFDKNGKPINCQEVNPLPHYPTGDKELFQFLARNIHYPTIDQENGKQGTVLLDFIVTEQGSIEAIKVVKSVSPTIDEEAIRVVSLTSPWVPSYEGDTPKRAHFRLPVAFRME